MITMVPRKEYLVEGCNVSISIFLINISCISISSCSNSKAVVAVVAVGAEAPWLERRDV